MLVSPEMVYRSLDLDKCFWTMCRPHGLPLRTQQHWRWAILAARGSGQKCLVKCEYWIDEQSVTDGGRANLRGLPLQ